MLGYSRYDQGHRRPARHRDWRTMPPRPLHRRSKCHTSSRRTGQSQQLLDSYVPRFMPIFMQKLQNRIFLQFIPCCLIGLILCACSGPDLLPTPLPTAGPLPPPIVSATAPETLPALIVAERQASITGNLPLLAALWANDGRIVDGRGSAELNDDYRWVGRAAILDRYELAVFPAPPPP